MCREHTPAAVAALVRALDEPQYAVPAARELLTRGWGPPAVSLNVTSEQPGALHLLAATLVSEAIINALGDEATKPQPPQIDARPENVLDSPKPTE